MKAEAAHPSEDVAAVIDAALRQIAADTWRGASRAVWSVRGIARANPFMTTDEVLDKLQDMFRQLANSAAPSVGDALAASLAATPARDNIAEAGQ